MASPEEDVPFPAVNAGLGVGVSAGVEMECPECVVGLVVTGCNEVSVGWSWEISFGSVLTVLIPMNCEEMVEMRISAMRMYGRNCF
jgi:hypothetical protein